MCPMKIDKFPSQMSSIIEVYISQSDIPNWALNPGVDSSIQWTSLVQQFHCKEQRQKPQMQECGRHAWNLSWVKLVSNASL